MQLNEILTQQFKLFLPISSYTPFTPYNRLSVDNRFDNRVERTAVRSTGCQTGLYNTAGCQTGCQTGLRTG